VTDTGKLVIDVPRDRESSFDPQLIPKYSRASTTRSCRCTPAGSRNAISTRIPSSRTSSTGCLRQVTWRPDEIAYLALFLASDDAAIAREAHLPPTRG